MTAEKHRPGTRLSEDEARERMRATGWEPLTRYPGYVWPWPSRCTTCRHEARPRLGHPSRCPICAGSQRGKRVPEDEAKERMRAAGWEPLTRYPGSSKPWPCRCTACDATAEPHFQRPIRCRACVEDEARERMRAAGWEPLTRYLGSAKRWPSRCTKCGHEAEPRPRRPAQCVECTKQHGGGLLPRLSEDEARERMRAAGWEPLTRYPGSAKPWPSQCTKCSNKDEPRLNNAARGMAHCRRCTGDLPGTRLSEDEARERMRAAGWEPLTRYPGSSKPWPSRCTKCGHEAEPQLKQPIQCRICRL